jgi:hypothetical protein
MALELFNWLIKEETNQEQVSRSTNEQMNFLDEVRRDVFN